MANEDHAFEVVDQVFCLLKTLKNPSGTANAIAVALADTPEKKHALMMQAIVDVSQYTGASLSAMVSVVDDDVRLNMTYKLGAQEQQVYEQVKCCGRALADLSLGTFRKVYFGVPDGTKDQEEDGGT